MLRPSGTSTTRRGPRGPRHLRSRHGPSGAQPSGPRCRKRLVPWSYRNPYEENTPRHRTRSTNSYTGAVHARVAVRSRAGVYHGEQASQILPSNREGADQRSCPRQDSNLRHPLRRGKPSPRSGQRIGGGPPVAGRAIALCLVPSSGRLRTPCALRSVKPGPRLRRASGCPIGFVVGVPALCCHTGRALDSPPIPLGPRLVARKSHAKITRAPGRRAAACGSVARLRRLHS